MCGRVSDSEEKPDKGEEFNCFAYIGLARARVGVRGEGGSNAKCFAK